MNTNARIGGNLAFSKFLNGFQLEQLGGVLRIGLVYHDSAEEVGRLLVALGKLAAKI